MMIDLNIERGNDDELFIKFIFMVCIVNYRI